MKCKRSVTLCPDSVLCMWMSSCPSTTCWKTVFVPLCYLCSCIRHWLAISRGSVSGLWTLFSWSGCSFTSTTLSQCCSLKSGVISPPILFSSNIRWFFIFASPYNLYNQFVNIHTISCWDFHWDCMTLRINVGRTNMLTMSSLPVCNMDSLSFYLVLWVHPSEFMVFLT